MPPLVPHCILLGLNGSRGAVRVIAEAWAQRAVIRASADPVLPEHHRWGHPKDMTAVRLGHPRAFSDPARSRSHPRGWSR